MILDLKGRFASLVSMADLTLEMLNEGHLDELVSIEKRVNATPWSQANFISSLKKDLCVGVFCGRTLVAYCIVLQSRYECEILLVAVDLPFQRKGIARALLRTTIDVYSEHHAAAANENNPAFFLEVRLSNMRAQRLYESLGFNEVGTRPDYYLLPSGGKEDAVIYAYQAIQDLFS